MRGIIDVGSNSVRLGVFDCDYEVYSETVTTRLGSGLIKTNKMNEEDIANTVLAISRFVKICESYNVTPEAFGTAACRQAENASELLKRVRNDCGVDIRVLSGEDEAKIAFFGGCVLTNSFPCAVIDVGGASTEIAVGDEERLYFSKSYPIGAVKAYGGCLESKEETRRYVETAFEGLKKLDANTVIAIGGTATSLSSVLSGEKRYDKSVTHGFTIKRSALDALCNDLFDMGLEGRCELSMITQKRAEIIASGAMIFRVLMEKLDLQEITTSESDNLYGYTKVFEK